MRKIILPLMVTVNYIFANIFANPCGAGGVRIAELKVYRRLLHDDCDL